MISTNTMQKLVVSTQSVCSWLIQCFNLEQVWLKLKLSLQVIFIEIRKRKKVMKLFNRETLKNRKRMKMDWSMVIFSQLKKELITFIRKFLKLKSIKNMRGNRKKCMKITKVVYKKAFFGWVFSKLLLLLQVHHFLFGISKNSL